MRLTLLALLITFPTQVFADQQDGRLEIESIGSGVYLHTSYKALPNIGYYPSNGLVVMNNNDAYIIDTPWPEKDIRELTRWIEKSGFTLKASISTHFHEDRTSGIAYLNQLGVPTYAFSKTNQLLAVSGAATATIGFEGPEFSILHGVIEAFHPGPGHSMDNIVIWLPQAQMLFGGCLIREQATNSMGNTADGSLEDWANTVQNVVDRFPQIKQVIPGHGSVGDASLLAHTQRLAAEALRRQSEQF